MANNKNFTKKLPVVILAVALAFALVLALVANNGKNAVLDYNEQLSTYLTELQTQADTTAADLEAKTAELTTAQADLEAAKAEAEAKQAELEAAKAEVEAKLAETEAAAETKAAELTAAAEEAKAAAETQAAELTAAAEAAKADADAKIAELEAAKADAEAKIAELEAAKTEAEAKVAELEAAKADAESKAAAVEAELAAAIVASAPAASDALAGKVIILHTNDVHGNAQATEDAFGYARIAQMKKNLVAQGAEVLLVDAGDYSQGTPIVNSTYGKNAVAFMNAAGYDIATVGNHEFDWGSDNLLQNLETAEFTVLCANLTRTADATLVFDANKVIETSIGKIGVFGLATPETMTKAHPDKVKGVTFSQAEALYADAQKQVDELTAAGCDVIVAIGHLGVDDESITNRSIDVLSNVNGIDLFIDGHSHTTIDGGELVGETLLTSTGSHSGSIGYVVIEKTEAEEGVSYGCTAGLYTVEENAEAEFALGGGLTSDIEVAQLVADIDAEINALWSTPFAKTEVLLEGTKGIVRTEETNLGDFAADAILWAAKQAIGDDKVQAALTNGGGIRASIEAGDVNMLMMKTVFPFGNEVATLTVTGAELLEALESATFAAPESAGAFPQVAGIEFTVDTTVPYENGAQYPDSTYYAPANPGARVTIATVNGQPWAADAVYTIATNDFTAAGGDTYYVFKYPFTQTGYKTGVALEDALINYTQNVLGGTIGADYAAPAGRITIIK
ncbi:MAG: bifunctional metallophosphatase/5'-nucleotidase [Clostridia bacterium]|nr:bifunctional metallophosphatase/5'-nucleotidase [Clostridia bacterium]